MFTGDSQDVDSKDVLMDNEMEAMDTVGINKARKGGTSFIEQYGSPMAQTAAVVLIVLLSAIISANSIATKISNNIVDEVDQVLLAVDEANAGISTDADGNLVTADGDVVTTKSLTQQTSVYDLATFSITTLQELTEVIVTDGTTTYIIRSDYVEKPAANEVIVVSGVGLELYVSQDTALLTLRNGDVVDVTTSLHTTRRQLDNGDVVETGATISGTDIEYATYATTEAITYTELSTYTCESDFYSDCQVITDESVCDTAAAFLGWSDTTSKMQTEDQYKVYGCSLYSDTSLQLNPLSSSTKECSEARPCACQGTCGPAEFLELTEGVCEDLYDCASISTTELCDAAVTELGWADTTSAEQTPSIYKTNGCIMFSETSTQLNLVSDSNKDCSDYTCACVGQCAPVTEVTSGFCTDYHDCAPIESEEDCSSAAVKLEWIDTTATIQASSGNKPHGCFSDSYTQVNVASDSDVQCSDSQICACIGTCIEISTSTSTSTTTTMTYYGTWEANWGDSACSVQCGLGTRSVDIVCMSHEPSVDGAAQDDWKVLDDDMCDPALRPDDEESCSVACLYVSPTGSDQNDGLDISNPFGSVQACVDVSQDQFTITATEITSGFCSDYDSCQMITDIDNCDVAAAILDWDDTKAAEKTESGFAAGCLKRNDAYTWLNVEYTSTVECSSDRPCACQGVCTSTDTTPIAFVDDTPDTVRCLLLEGTYTETQIDILEKSNLIIEAYNDDIVVFDGTDVVENLIWYETLGLDGLTVLEAQLPESVERVDVIVDTKSMQCSEQHGIQREPCVIFDPTEGYGWGSFYAKDDIEYYYDNTAYGRRHLESDGYVEINTATCEAHDDCSLIDDVDQCSIAAAALGWGDTTAAEVTPNVWKPNGCIKNSATATQLNLEPDTNRNCGHNDKSCACRGTCTVPDYTELNTGSCSDYSDCAAITDTALCSAAAGFLGWSDDSAAEQTPSIYKTHGCIQFSTTSTQMNDEEDSERTCDDYTCACAGTCGVKPTTNEYVFVSSDEAGQNPTWTDYNMACRSRGGYLATISSEADQIAACANCTGQTCYAGGYTYNDPNPTQLDSDDENDLAILWVDGEEYGAFEPNEVSGEGVLRLDENCAWSFDGDEDTFDDTVAGAVCKLGFDIPEAVIPDFWLSSDKRIQVRSTSGFTIENPPTIRVKNSDRVEAFEITSTNEHVWISGLHFFGTTCCGSGPTAAANSYRNNDVRLLHSHFLYTPRVVRLFTTASTGRGKGLPVKIIGNTFAFGGMGTVFYKGSASTFKDNIALFNSYDYRGEEGAHGTPGGTDFQSQSATLDTWSWRCYWSNNTFLYNGEMGGFYNWGTGNSVSHNYVMGQSYLMGWTDTAAVHVLTNSQPDTEIAYNWFLGPSNAKSVRLDTAVTTLPHEAGTNTTMHHNVFFGMEPFTIKGYNHSTHHSTGDIINFIESWELIHDMNWNSTATYNAVANTQARGSTAPNSGAPGHTYLNMCDDMLICNSDLYGESPSWFDSSQSVSLYDEINETFLDQCPACYLVDTQLDVPTGEPLRPQEFDFSPIENSALILENGDGYVGAYDPNADYWIPGCKRDVTPFPFLE